MVIGLREIIKTKHHKNQYVTTRFLWIGLPIFPVQSYFVYDTIVEIGSHEIPLNGCNVLKNYLAVYLSAISFMGVILNLLVGQEFYGLLLYEILPASVNLDWLTLQVETLITLSLTALSVYFVFFYGRITDNEKTERDLLQRNDFANIRLPGKKLVPMLYSFYNKSDQQILLNQLMAIWAKIISKRAGCNDDTSLILDGHSIVKAGEKSLEPFLANTANVKKADASNLSFIFTILAIKRVIGNTPQVQSQYVLVRDSIEKK